MKIFAIQISIHLCSRFDVHGLNRSNSISRQAHRGYFFIFSDKMASAYNIDQIDGNQTLT